MNQWDGPPHSIPYCYAKVEGLINYEAKEHLTNEDSDN